MLGLAGGGGVECCGVARDASAEGHRELMDPGGQGWPVNGLDCIVQPLPPVRLFNWKC